MNPNDHVVVRFTNRTDFDFTAEMGAMYGGVPYFVPAGKSLLVPKTIGLHLAKHLARQAFIKKAPLRDEKEVDGKGTDRPLWDDEAMKAMEGRFVSEEYEEERPPVLTEAEVQKRKVEELNKNFLADEGPAEVELKNDNASDAPVAYADKAEVIEELEKRKIPHDKRKSKAALEELLK